MHHVGERRGMYWVLVREPEGMRPGVDGRILLRWILRKWDVEGRDWIELVQDRDRWRARVNTVMKLRVP